MKSDIIFERTFKVFPLALVLIVVVASLASAALNVSLSNQGSDVRNKTSNSLLTSGNLQVLIYDNASAGNLIYAENFTNGISNGRWNVMLGENTSNPLPLEFGKKYYMDYKIGGEDVNFTDILGNPIDRQFFYSSLGDVGGEDISPTANLSIGQKITFAFGEMIDNIADGYLRLTGNLNVTNNLTVSGRVGIGTASPAKELHVSGSGVQTIRITGTNTGPNGNPGPLLQLEDLGNVTWNIESGRGALGGLTFFGNNSVRMFLGPTGKVGIGTTSPSNNLEVSNTGASTWLQVTQTGNGNFFSNIRADSDDSAIALTAYDSEYTDLSNYAGHGVLGTWNSADDLIIKGKDSNIRFDTDNHVERARITSAGLVGINTTSPNQLLHVAGNANFTGALYAGTFSPSALSTSVLNVSGQTLLATSSGNVGINTDSPDVRLEVGSGDLWLDGNGVSRDPTLYFRYTSTNATIASDTSLIFNTGATPTPRAIIGSTGNVGIGMLSPTYLIETAKTSSGKDVNLSGALYINGTSGRVSIGTASPAATLHVVAAVPTVRLETSSATEGVSYQSKSASGTSSWGRETSSGQGILTGSSGNSTVLTTGGTETSMHFGTNDSVRMTINGEGNVGIGSNSPVDRLHVSGGNILIDNEQFFRAKDSGGVAKALIGRDSSDKTNVYAGGDFRFNDFNSNSLFYIKDIGTTGSIGINTTNPANLLNVLGDANITGALYAGTFAPSSLSTSVLNVSGQTLLATSGGNVGIGTGNPVTRFDVNDSGGRFYLNLSISSPAGNPILFYSGNSNGRPTIRGGSSEALTLDTYESFNLRGPNFLLSDESGNVIGSFSDNSADDLVISTPNGDIFLDTGNSFGKVGIGTPIPSQLLEVNGSANITASLFAASVKVPAGADTSPAIQIRDVNNGFYSPGGSSLGIVAGGGERIRIDGSNNLIGINTTTPNQLLTVAGNTNITGNLYAGTFSPSALSTSVLNVSGQTLLATSIGAVGIGTTSPTSGFKLDTAGNIRLGNGTDAATNRVVLQFNKGGYSNPTVNSNADGDKIIIYDQGASYKTAIGMDGNGDMWLQSNTAFRWYNGSTPNQVMSLVNGNLGLGVTSPSSKLDVAGNFEVDDLDFFVNATSGNVGVGTATPTTTLHVLGDSKVDGRSFLNSNSDAQLYLNGSGTDWAGINFRDVYDADTIWFHGGNKTWAMGGGGASVSGKKLHVDGGVTIGSSYDAEAVPTNGLRVEGNTNITGTLYAGTFSPSSLSTSVLNVSGQTLLATSSGNVGIGTTNPQDELHVAPNSAGEITIKISNTSSSTVGRSDFRFGISNAAGVAFIDSNNANSGTDFPIMFAIQGVEKMRLNTNGNVGIGTASPSALLQVQKDQAGLTSLDVLNDLNSAGASARLRVTVGGASADDPYLMWGVSNGVRSYAMGIDNSDSDKLKITTNASSATADISTSTSLVTIDTSGNVGIGTTAPAQKFEVVGSANITGNLYVGGVLINGSGLTSSQWTSTGGNAYLTNLTGKVGIGTNSPTYTLSVTGNISASQRLVIGPTSPDYPLYVYETAGSTSSSINNYRVVPTLGNSYTALSNTHYVTLPANDPGVANYYNGLYNSLYVSGGNATAGNSAYPAGFVNSYSYDAKNPITGPRGIQNYMYISSNAKSVDIAYGQYNSLNLNGYSDDVPGPSGVGFYSEVNQPYNSSIPSMTNIHARNYISGTNSSATTVIGIANQFWQIAYNSSVTNLYGFQNEFYNYQFAGSNVTNAYGLHLGALKAPNVRNAYGVYQVGADDINYFQGKVGIGTNTPSSQLDVQGNISSTGQTSLATSNGRVGIGTSSPGALLQIHGGSPSDSSSGIQFGTDTSANLYRSNTATVKTSGSFHVAGQSLIIDKNDARIEFQASNISRQLTGRIDLNLQNDLAIMPGSGGKVGIGTTSPTQKLDVAGNVNVTAMGNVTFNQNNQGLHFGPQNNASIYWDGSKLVIKVN